MRYIDAKSIVNLIITKTADELKSKYTEEDIKSFLNKYQCKTVRDMVELMVCQNSNPAIDFNSKNFIKNIEDELFEMKYEDSINKMNITNQMNNYEKELQKSEEQKEIEALLKIKEEMNLSKVLMEQIDMILKKYGLDYQTELKNLYAQNQNKDKKINSNIGLDL